MAESTQHPESHFEAPVINTNRNMVDMIDNNNNDICPKLYP